MPLESSRDFALHYVSLLQAAGHSAYWVGGCVRDALRGEDPKDYDIATSALPDAVLRLIPGSSLVGVSFGVVLAPGRIEIATFRSEDEYHDGRRPEVVRYETDPALDAYRRDFTINAIYFDPIAGRHHDFTGGVTDLETHTIRAIGKPEDRFEEDHLRLLRAVRFAARFGFVIEPLTLAAMQQLAPRITRIAGERIHDEMRRILTGPNLNQAWHWLSTAGLLPHLLPQAGRGERLARLAAPASLALGWAALLEGVEDPGPIFRAYNFSNEERRDCRALLEGESTFLHLRQMKTSALKRLIRHPGFADQLRLHIATYGHSAHAEFALQMLQHWTDEDLNPEPLLNGNDLARLGIPAGPRYKAILRVIEDAQLEGEISSRDQALKLALAESRRHVH